MATSLGMTSISFLLNFWGNESGWVHLPTRSVSGSWTEHPFKWPEQSGKIERFLESGVEQSADLYFSPRLFDGRGRISDNAQETCWLYADLDPINPEALSPRPTIAWQTSAGRYQCAWRLNEPIPNFLQGELNRGLTRAIGADPSGWDATQVLRVPGSLNHKRETPEEVVLLWDDGPTHRVGVFDRFREAGSSKDTATSSRQSLASLLSEYPLKKSTSILLQYPPADITQGNRSEMLYRLSAELVEARVPMEVAYEMLRLSAWNKFAGRDDEEQRLREVLDKNYAKVVAKSSVSPEGFARAKARFEPTSFADLMAGADVGPRWLVEDLWTLEGHGIVAGEPKTFKSTIALDLCISVASGKPLWRQYAVPRGAAPVLVIQNENAPWIQRERLGKIVASKGLLGKASVSGRKVVGSWGKNLPFASIDCAGFSFDDDMQREAMWKVIEDFKPALVVFDPLYQMTAADVNSAKDLNATLRWLMAVRSELHTGVMLIHHFNKNGLATRGGQRMLGSTTLHGWTESALYTSGLESLGDGAARITVEREFRAAGAMDRLVLSIDQSQGEYRVDVGEASEVEREAVKSLIQKSGGKIKITALEKEAGMSRKKALAAVPEGFEVVKEGRTSVIRPRVANG